MHRALQIAEIIDNIFIELDNASLATLCSTCRLFFVPAASILWKTIDRQTRVNALTSILFGRVAKDPGLPLQSRATRFSVYAAFIRQLSAFPKWPDDWDWEQEIHRYTQPVFSKLQDLAFLYHTAPVFPALQSLRWMALSPSDVHGGIQFLTGSLNEVHLWCHFDHHSLGDARRMAALIDFLEVLVDRCPHLVQLSVVIRGVECSTHTRILQAVRYFRELTAFKCNLVLDPQLLLSLADLPQLKAVSFLCPWSSRPRNAMSISTPLPHLPLLRVLQADTSLSSALCLVCTYSNQLHALQLNLYTPNHFPAVELGQLMNSISLCANLVSLWLCIGEDGVGSLETTMSMDLLSPMLCCQQIRVLSLEIIRTSFVICDEHMESLAKAFTLLQTLRVQWTESRNSLTLRTLHSLATHCPELCSAFITRVDVPNVPYLAPPSSPNTHFVSLTFLAADCYAPAEDVAAFIRGLWPSLSQANAEGYREPYNRGAVSEGWKRVDSFLKNSAGGAIALHNPF